MRGIVIYLDIFQIILLPLELRRKINAHNKGHKGHGRLRSKRDDQMSSRETPDPIAIQESLIRRRKWMEKRVQDLSTGVQDERLQAIHNKYMTTKKRRRGFNRTKRSVNDNSVYFPSVNTCILK